jgi:type IV pilus assembly protein PilM
VVSARTVILDCGASRTALGVFTRQGGRLCLEHYAVEQFAPAIGSTDHWQENTRAALQALRHGLKTGGPVVLVLPAHLILSRPIRTPRVDAAQREKIIRFEAGQAIPSALTEVVWESVVTGEDGPETEVLLIAAKLAAVESLCAAAAAAGFEPRAVLPSPLATLAGFRLVPSLRLEPSLVLNLGARSATLLLAESRRFAVRTFPLIGHDANHPAEALVARLAQEVARLVAPSQQPGRMPLPGIMHLTGGGAGLPGLGEALAAKLAVVVRRLDLRSAIDTTRVKAGKDMADQVPTDLAGAAASQLFLNQPVLDLLPPQRRQRDDFRRRHPWLLAAGLLAVTTLLPPLVHFHRLANEAREKTAAIERELAPWRSRGARNRDRLQKIQLLGQEIALLQGIAARRTSWLDLLADVQDRLLRVEDVWLDQLQVAPGPAGTPWRLRVSGRMLDRTSPLARVSPETSERVRAILAGLAGSPFVAAVEAEQFDSNQPGILKFDFVLVTNPQRPL